MASAALVCPAAAVARLTGSVASTVGDDGLDVGVGTDWLDAK